MRRECGLLAKISTSNEFFEFAQKVRLDTVVEPRYDRDLVIIGLDPMIQFLVKESLDSHLRVNDKKIDHHAGLR